MQDRRTFLKTLGATAATISLAGGESQSDKLGPVLPTRKLGRHDLQITAFTLGGSHCEKAPTEKESQNIIETAIELGVRSFDNARNYGKGNAEVVYGKFLTPKYREHIFLTTKTSKSTAKEARTQLEESLRLMKTDYLDLWQIHGITTPKDVDNRIKNGVLDEFLKAREEGKVRYLGFTGHNSFKAHLHMLKRLRERETPFDTCLMPMNLLDPHYDSFIVNVLPELLKEDYGVFAMKTMAAGNMLGIAPFWSRKDGKERISLETIGIGPKEMHEYIYSLPITSLVSGCEHAKELRSNIAILKNYNGLDTDQRDQLLAKTKTHAGREMEFYKAKDRS